MNMSEEFCLQFMFISCNLEYLELVVTKVEEINAIVKNASCENPGELQPGDGI